MSQECLRTGDKAMIRFRFIKYPEYMVPGQRMVFREGRTKAVGNVVKIFTHLSNTQLTSRTKQTKNPQRFPPQNTRSNISEMNKMVEECGNVESSSEKRELATKSNSNKKSRGKRGGKNKTNQLGPTTNKPLSDVANITPINVANRSAAKVQ